MTKAGTARDANKWVKQLIAQGMKLDRKDHMTRRVIDPDGKPVFQALKFRAGWVLTFMNTKYVTWKETEQP